MALPQMGTNSAARRKWVYFEGTDTIYEGMPVCYNFDTTDNILGWSGSAASGTTAEGGQNEGKFMRVELPTATNLQFFAGVVAGTAKAGLAGPGWLDIYEANGAIVPVRTNVSCTVGVTALAIKAATAYFTNPIYGGSTASAVLMALANETVDRSSTTGLVLAKLGNVGIVQGHGVSSNQLVIGSGVTTEVELIPNFMSYKSLQTDGSFDVLRIRGEIAGAGGSCPLGVLRAEAVINSASQGTPAGMWVASAISANLILKTGSTTTGKAVALDVCVENQDSTPGTVSAAELYAIQSRLQCNAGAPSILAHMYFSSDGTSDPGYWFVAKDIGALSSLVSVSNAPALATGDLMIKIKVGAATYYIPAMADSGQ